MRKRHAYAAGSILRTLLGVGLAVVLLTSPRVGAMAATPARGEHAVIVKYRAEGPAAVDRCAEGLSRSGEDFASATRDASDSLDRLQRRLRLGPHRALLGARRAESLSERRARLADHASSVPSASSLRSRAVDRRAVGRASRHLSDLAHVYRVAIPAEASAAEVAAALAADPHVEYAQPDHVNRLDETDFDDPFLSSSGAWGQPYADLWGLQRVGAPLAWSQSQGEGIVVAVVDTGLDHLHPDIADNVWVNPGEDLDGDGRAGPEDPNGLDDDGNGFVDDLIGFDFANSVDADEDGSFDGPNDVSDPDPFDDIGHGTHVAGTIAAVADNGIGIAGVAPRARIMAVKGFGTTGAAADSVLWRGVLYAAMNGADVINNSWSCGTPCPENPLADDVLEVVESLGTVVVTSAGNATTDVVYNSPEKSRRVVTVGSIGADDAISSFSNRGWLIDVVAPGGGPPISPGVFVARRNILSLLSSGTQEQELAFAVAEDYYRLAGTSMAAPHVAGAAALLLAARPELLPADVRRLIRLSAMDRGEVGRDPVYGPGLLDLQALLEAPAPELALAITEPVPGATLDPSDGDVVILGMADGADLSTIAIEVGFGLTPRVFRPLDGFGDPERLGGSVANPSETRELARWDVAELAPGPRVIRLRAGLADGRVAEELSIVGLERIAPRAISSGAERATAPAIAGRRVVWQQADATGDGFEQDLFGSFLPASAADPAAEEEVVPVVEAAGDQRNVVIDGADLVWRSVVDGAPRLEHCRWDARRGRCRARTLVEGEQTPTAYWLERGRLVWMGERNGTVVPLGCRIRAAGRSGCIPRPLLADDADAAGWSLQSFDGRSLLLQRGLSEVALCSLPRGMGGCRPVLLDLATTPFAAVFRPMHDGRLVAYEEVANRRIVPPGCESGDGSDFCSPRNVLSTRIHACWIDLETSRCDGAPISDFVALDDAGGLDLDGDRIVWSIGSLIERAALHFCEFDVERRECIDQRLTGHVAAAEHPRLDGRRIVWEDARSGPRAIHGFELPGLHTPKRWWSARGGRFAIPILASAGSADGLRYSLQVETESGVEAVPFQRRPLGRRAVASHANDGPGLLIGRLPESQGDVPVRLRIRATTSDGLFTDAIVEMNTKPPGERRLRPPGERRLRP